MNHVRVGLPRKKDLALNFHPCRLGVCQCNPSCHEKFEDAMDKPFLFPAYHGRPNYPSHCLLHRQDADCTRHTISVVRIRGVGEVSPHFLQGLSLARKLCEVRRLTNPWKLVPHPFEQRKGSNTKARSHVVFTTASERIYGRFFDAIVGIVTLGVCGHATLFGKPNQTQGRL